MHFSFNGEHNWKGGHDRSKGAENLHLGLLQLSHLSSDSGTRNDGLCDSRSRIGRADPAARIEHEPTLERRCNGKERRCRTNSRWRNSEKTSEREVKFLEGANYLPPRVSATRTNMPSLLTATPFAARRLFITTVVSLVAKLYLINRPVLVASKNSTTKFLHQVSQTLEKG